MKLRKCISKSGRHSWTLGPISKRRCFICKEFRRDLLYSLPRIKNVSILSDKLGSDYIQEQCTCCPVHQKRYK